MDIIAYVMTSTKNARRLSDQGESSLTSPTSTTRVSSRSSTCDKILFTPDCIFCNKVESKQLYNKGRKKLRKHRNLNMKVAKQLNRLQKKKGMKNYLRG